MAKAEKWFKTRDELMTYISKTDLRGADVLGLCVRFDEENAVSGVAPVEPTIVTAVVEEDEEAELISAREAYAEKLDKKVPNNKKNDTEWLKAQVAGK